MAEPKLSALDAFMSLARERMRVCVDAESKPRERQLHDYKFSAGGDYQWTDSDRDLRKGRPMLTNNRVDQYAKQVVNQMRQARPTGRVNPVDTGADRETADLLQGVLRRIDDLSNADVAYATAGDHIVRMGIGFVRVVPEYADGSTDQELRIKRIRNRFTVYVDPAAAEPDASDARFIFIVEDLDSDPETGAGEYQQRYPKSDVSSLTEFSSVGDQQPTWFPNGKVRIAEYFYRHLEKAVVVKLSDGRQGYQDEIGQLPPNVTVIAQRVTERVRICWATINGIEVLEGNKQKNAGRALPIPFMPVIRGIGDEFDIDGEVDYRGLVRNAIDPQKTSNFIDSATVETVATAPKNSFIAEVEQIAEHKEQWDNLNRKNYGTLYYKRIMEGGTLVPPPQRSGGVDGQTLAALSLVGQQAQNSLRAVLGFVDVNAHEGRDEKSGRAILARQKQGEMGNSHLMDGLARLVRQTNRVILAWLPHIYDAQRILRIAGEDGKEREVMLYTGAANKPPQLPEGVEKAIDLSSVAMSYDLTISVGQDYESQRDEANSLMLELIKVVPQFGIALGDILAENQPGKTMQQAAARLRKALPPEFQDEEQGQQEIPPQVKQQMMQMAQQQDILVKELEAKTQYIETEQAKQQAQIQMKQAELAMKREEAQQDAELEIQKAHLKAETEIQIAEMKLRAEVQIAQMKARIDAQQQQQAMAVDAQQHDHELTQQAHMADRAHAHEAEQADADRAHTGEQAERDRAAQVEMHGMGSVDSE